MTFRIQRLAAASAFALLVAGCANLWDVHAPATVRAGPDGGAVTVKHGERLLIPFYAQPDHEWRRMEPRVLNVVLEGPPNAESGMFFTPVRSGEETLRFEYWPLSGATAPVRTVSYDVTVPEQTGIFSGFWSRLFSRRPRSGS
jgi:hypothetical protein